MQDIPDELLCMVVADSGRKLYFDPNLDAAHEDEYRSNYGLKEATVFTANLVSSAVSDGPTSMHKPIFDFDGFPVYVIPSSTPGHYHLYIDKEITKQAYDQILAAFLDAGLVQRGWVRNLSANGQTFLRMPGVKKKCQSEQSTVHHGELSE